MSKTPTHQHDGKFHYELNDSNGNPYPETSGLDHLIQSAGDGKFYLAVEIKANEMVAPFSLATIQDSTNSVLNIEITLLNDPIPSSNRFEYYVLDNQLGFNEFVLTVKDSNNEIRRKGTCDSSNIRRKDDTLERATTNQTPQPFISNFSYTSGSPHLQQDSAYSGAFGDYVLVAKHVGQNAVIIRNESGMDHRLEVDMVGIAGGMVSWQRVYLNNYNGGDIGLSVHEGNGIRRRGVCSSGNVNRDK
jgi:hypothetical protein